MMPDSANVSSMLPPHLGMVSGRYGTFVYPRLDQYVGPSLENYGEFSELETELFRQVIRPGQTVIEVGANIGALTIPLARIVGPTGRVYAFEPQPPLFHILCSNIALNGLFNVDARPMGIGSKTSVLQVPYQDYTAAQNFGAISLTEKEGYSVDVFPLDGLAFPAADFIKIDVEGMEAEVLMGATKTIARFRPILFVENDRDDKSSALIGMLLGMGYRLWWHVTHLFNPDNFFKKQENIFGAQGSMNMLCIPREQAADIKLPEILDANSRWQSLFSNMQSDSYET